MEGRPEKEVREDLEGSDAEKRSSKWMKAKEARKEGQKRKTGMPKEEVTNTKEERQEGLRGKEDQKRKEESQRQ